LENSVLKNENVELSKRVLLLEAALRDSDWEQVTKAEDGSILVKPNSEELATLSQLYDNRVETMSWSTKHWKTQTDRLMNKYYPLIKELQREWVSQKKKNQKLAAKLANIEKENSKT